MGAQKLKKLLAADEVVVVVVEGAAPAPRTPTGMAKGNRPLAAATALATSGRAGGGLDGAVPDNTECLGRA